MRLEVNHPKSVKLKMREFKLISGVNWQVALKQKDLKQTIVGQDFGVIIIKFY
jgi:hypothetical protein